MQAEYVFTRLNRVLAQAGTSLAQAVESQLYEPNLLTFHDVDAVWGNCHADPAATELDGSERSNRPGRPLHR